MNLIMTFFQFVITKLNLGNMPLQNSTSSSFDLESNSPLPVPKVISPVPSSSELQIVVVPEKHTVSPFPPSSSDQDDLSSPVTIMVSSSQALNTNGPPAENHDAHTMWLQHLLFVGGVCYAAVSATLQALQGTRPLSATSKIVYAALLVSFTVFVVSVYIRTNYPRASAIAVHVGSLSGFAAFLVALFSSLTRRH